MGISDVRPLRPLKTPIVSAILLVAIAAGMAGCPATNSQLPEPQLRIRALALLYGQYVSRHRGQPPANEAEFKKFVTSQDKSFWESQQMDPANVDQVFISPVDNAPYVVGYKLKNATMPGPDGKAPVVIWEKTGSGGKRWTATSLGEVTLLDDEEFKKRVPNPD